MDYIIFGKHTVISAFRNGRAKTLYLDNKNKAPQFKNANFQIKNKQFFNKLSKNLNIAHQGFAALVSPIKDYSLKKHQNKNFCKLVALQGVLDQRNIGSIIRSCAAFEIDGLIIEKKGFNESSLLMNKTHAGNIENINISKVSNLINTIKLLKKNDFSIYCLDQKSQKEVKSFNFSKKCLLIFGSEERGIKNYIKKECDDVLKIKIKDSVESLNLSSAVAVTLSHI